MAGSAFMTLSALDSLAVNTIRTLSMDAVQQANSGHPGTPMALAPVIYALWQRRLRFDPADPAWPVRDRFVLSCGHASMLLYSMLHLAEVRQLDSRGRPTDEPAVGLDQIRRFRQWQSRCPGHPEHGHTSGVETTTGPLGQGLGNSVGMALAQRWLAARYTRPGHELFNYNVYALASDGDLMEGVGAEAASLAGHLALSNLCWIYDHNRITIDGTTALSFDEDVAARFAGYGWQVLRVGDANDLATLDAAWGEFEATLDRPTLIIVKSQIGYGAPHKQGTSEAHGAPLGEEEIRLAKAAYGWPTDAKFLVPDEVRAHLRAGLVARGRQAHAEWNTRFASYRTAFPDLAAEYLAREQNELPAGWAAQLPVFPADAKGLATRDSSSKVLNAVAASVPWFLGGAADLASSTKTTIKTGEAGDVQAGRYGGRNMHFGIREHAMAAALNGMALSNLRPFGSTFLVFSDYCRPSMRLSAIMNLPVAYIFTHDSIGVGEDGPTHQPIEHLAALRAIPGLVVWRPGDANEVTEAYRSMLARRDRPAALILTRQALPTLDRARFAPAAGAARGGYVLADPPQGRPRAILIATGSEVALCMAAYEQLAGAGVPVRVVSLPSWETFDEQDAAYRAEVLPPDISARVAVEMGIEQGWQRYLGSRGQFVGMSGFGASAPWPELAQRFGFTVERVVAAVQAALGER